eukprot:2720042-Amphidinium_carterae.1
MAEIHKSYENTRHKASHLLIGKILGGMPQPEIDEQRQNHVIFCTEFYAFGNDGFQVLDEVHDVW